MSPAFRNAMEQSAGVVDVPGMSEPAPAPKAKGVPAKGKSPLARQLTVPLTNPFTNKPAPLPTSADLLPTAKLQQNITGLTTFYPTPAEQVAMLKRQGGLPK